MAVPLGVVCLVESIIFAASVSMAHVHVLGQSLDLGLLDQMMAMLSAPSCLLGHRFFGATSGRWWAVVVWCSSTLSRSASLDLWSCVVSVMDAG
jgi:hypothetical protein